VIDAVRVALTAIRARGNPAPGDLSVLALPEVRGVFLGVDDLRRPHLLLVMSDVNSPLPEPDVAALEIAIRPLELSGSIERFIDITCMVEAVADVFEHFAAAVADRVQTNPLEPVQDLLVVLEKWRQFLVPAKGPLGRAKLAEVFGEILVLRDVVAADPRHRVGCWVAPYGGRHDFRRGRTALEVKTTRAHSSREVVIHGEDQLEIPSGGSLHLHFVRIEEVPGDGETVNSIVDELLSLGTGTERLFESLDAAGVPLSELAATTDVSFQVRERLTVAIDDVTPRIIPASFVGGQKPVGVGDLSYVINLDHVLDRALDQAAYRKLVSELAGDD
jgi:hypothetical protein